MPTEADRKARRLAETRLERSYGWPEPEPKVTGWRLGLAWALAIVGSWSVVFAVGAGVALVLGWRP